MFAIASSSGASAEQTKRQFRFLLRHAIELSGGLRILEHRANNLIEKFLEHIEGTEHLRKVFHALVLKLTCYDDWHTLDTVLHYGKERKLTPEIPPGGNPIAIASEQVS